MHELYVLAVSEESIESRRNNPQLFPLRGSVLLQRARLAAVLRAPARIAAGYRANRVDGTLALALPPASLH